MISGTPTTFGPARHLHGDRHQLRRLDHRRPDHHGERQAAGRPDVLANPAVYTTGVAIEDNYPSSGGGAVASYAISPSLPPGLMFDGATGVISGMPAVGSPTITYTVTAANSGGSTQAPVMITVKVDVVVGTTGALAAGQFHACAIVNGGVECWGSNSDGQLGNGNSWGSYSPVPVPVDGLASGVQAITAGAYHTCALVNGGVLCWGSNSEGQLGTLPTAIPVAHRPSR